MFNTDIDSLILIIYINGLMEITSFDKNDNASFYISYIMNKYLLLEITT